MPDRLATPNRRILVIDDNTAIHADFRKIFLPASESDLEFERAGAALFEDTAKPASCPIFELDSASNGEEGLRMVTAAMDEGRPYAMAFIDMRMPPGWDGMQTTLKLWSVCPELQVVICTAYSDHSWEEMLEAFGHTDRVLLLKKPFDTLEVLQLAHALTEKWRLVQQASANIEHLEKSVAERTIELQTSNEALKAEMAERAKAEEALRQAQKMEAVGQLAAGVAHDFNNLLCVIRGYTGILLEREHSKPDTIDALREVDSAAERAANLTRQLLTFSRRQVVQPETLNLNEVVDQVTKLLRRVLGESIGLKMETAANLPSVRADRGMLEQIILNLAVNARDAMPEGGTLLITSSSVEFTAREASQHPTGRPGRFVRLSVTDGGCGISPEVMPHLFEPFFTTKEVGKGTGLGLATVYGIVHQHSGWIEVESQPTQGTTFHIFLPASAPSAEVPLPTIVPDRKVGGQETILLVEDEPALRLVSQLALEQFGYRVHLANSGSDALMKWPDYRNEIDLLLTDMVMPGGVSGRELGKRLLAEKPDLKVIYSSGYSLELSDDDGVLNEGLNFLPKPYTCAKLAAMVRGCLDNSNQPSKMVA